MLVGPALVQAGRVVTVAGVEVAVAAIAASHDLWAAGVQMIRTGELSFSVVTEYADEARANAAQSKIAEIRAQASGELPMSMSTAAAGGVFATG